MMNAFRGRNLKHPGCLIGVTIGLIVGIILAGVLAYANVPYIVLVVLWLGLTVVLGASGWIIGNRLTTRFAGDMGPVEAPEEERGEGSSKA
jgi:hypothetical protein